MTLFLSVENTERYFGYLSLFVKLYNLNLVTEKYVNKIILKKPYDLITKTPVTPEWHPYNFRTASRKLQITEVRAVLSPATLFTLWQRLKRHYFEHTQRQLRGMTFGDAVAALWGLLERAVGAQHARFENTKYILCL